MSTFRVNKDKENPYVMLNKSFLKDENLSLKAKGLLAYLLSLPDDWTIYENEIVKHSKDGKDSFKSAINELIKSGYIVKGKRNRVRGKLKGYDYVVYETPFYIGKSYVENSYVGKPANTNKVSLTNNNLKLNNECNNGSSADKLLSFLEFVNQDSHENSKDSLDTITNISFFMSKRRILYDFEEPKYKYETWEYIFREWFHVSDDYIGEFVSFDDSCKMINKFFTTKFENCDYSPAFYCSGEIKAKRFYECGLKGEY